MKIGYICSDVDIDVLGNEGCSNHIREFVTSLMEQGHEVFIICLWADADSSGRTKARVYTLEPHGHNKTAWKGLIEEPLIQEQNLNRDLHSMFWNTWLQTEGALILEKEKPDFLYERYALFGWGGLELSRRYNIPLLLEVNAPLCDDQEGYREFVLTNLARQMEQEILRNADAVIVVTQWLAEWAENYGASADRIYVFPNAVSEQAFSIEVSGDSVLEQLGLKGKRIVGFIGSFHWWHDVSGLIEAFAKIYTENLDIRLLLIGDGEQRKSLDEKVRDLELGDAVIFTGSIEHESVPAFLAAMDIAVVPYRHIEDFFFSPMKLFECMAVGCPTVAADLGQIAEVVDHGTTGWLYPAGNNEKLADGLRTLLSNPDLATRVGKNAKRYVLENHTWAKVTEAVTDVAERLIRAQENIHS